MSSELAKLLLNNGVSVAILAFFLWFILKPLINAYIKTLSDQSESMKELSKSMKAMTEMMPDLNNLEKKIYETREHIKQHIDSKFKQ